MVARNRLISLIYRILAFAVCVFSLVYHFSNNNGGESFLYFTILSGFLVTILIGSMLIANLIDLIRHGIRGIPAGIYMPIAMAGLVYITITALIGNIVFPAFTSTGVDVAPLFSHLLVPLVYLVDWIAFEEKGTVKWYTGLYWLLFPLLYGTFIYLRPFIWSQFTFPGGSKYPYPFMDPAQSGGVGQVVLNLILVGIGFLAVGYLFIFLNDLLAGKLRKRIKSE